MSEPRRCSNGHEIPPSDTFCGVCGGEAQQPVAPPSPGCPAGHQNPPGFDYCGTCGAAIVSTAETTPTAHTAPLSDDPPSQRSTWRAWAGVGIVTLVVVAIVVAANGGSDGDTFTEDDSTYEAVTTTTLVSDLCIQELALWMPYVSGEGSITDAAAEFGYSAPEYEIISNAHTEFISLLYQVGRDDASAASYDLLAQECIALGDAYEPGHLPPG